MIADPTQKSVESNSTPLPYSKPTLRVYGPVKQLTEAMFGTGMDGGGTANYTMT